MSIVSDETKKDWDEVFKMSVFEWLNIVCYVKDKNEYRSQEIKRWQRNH